MTANIWGVILIWAIAIVAFVLFNILISYLIISYILFVLHLKRRGKNRWTRDCSSDDPNQLKMYDEGRKWSERYAENKQDLHIVNEGLNMYAEFYDLHSDRAVIIIPGRTEGLRYGYYFAKPYTDNGYSVLTIDQRAHGESDGKYNTLGFDEHRDIIAWIKVLKENYEIKSVLLHGICIGGACGLYAITSKSCPDCVDGLVVEGMFQRFFESFKNHMIELNKPVNPCIHFVDMWIKLITGHSMKVGPINVIDKMKKPLLLLHSKEDKYSLPHMAQELFDKCASEKKQIVFFDHGAHSMLRITDTEKYDSSITAFIHENFPEIKV